VGWVSRSTWTRAKKNLVPTWVRTTIRLARSESLHRLSYPEAPDEWTVSYWGPPGQPPQQNLVARAIGALDVCTPGDVSLYQWINAKINFWSGSSPPDNYCSPVFLHRSIHRRRSASAVGSTSTTCWFVRQSRSQDTCGHRWTTAH
jgi:hypothetical protein